VACAPISEAARKIPVAAKIFDRKYFFHSFFLHADGAERGPESSELSEYWTLVRPAHMTCLGYVFALQKAALFWSEI
jgi:hypothetical protein